VRRLARLVGLAVLAAGLVHPGRPPKDPQVHPRHPIAPPPTARFGPAWGRLDLTGYRLSFEDRFDTLDVTADGGGGRWFAPVHSDFGRAHFLPPGPDGPFRLETGEGGRRHLAIRAEKRADGWTSGLMQTVDSHGHGFAQTYGYFEMRARLPDGPGTWPAFWLLTQQAFTDQTLPRGEIDVLEQYGRRPDRLHMAVHLWPAYADNSGGIADLWTLSKRADLRGMGRGFHRWGVLIEPRWTTFYYDGRALSRYPTLPAYRTPMYLLVNLAMHKRDLEAASGPYDMTVDYVRVWRRG
jgi:hypothetical protein